MKLILLLITLLLTGCEVNPSWQNAASTHTCTQEQFARVMTESKQLIDLAAKDGKYAEYWIGTSILRICEIKGVTK